MIPFFVCSTQRSGSTWIVDLLDSHPAIAAYSELFLEGGTGTPDWGGGRDLPFWSAWRAGRLAAEAPLERYLNQVFHPRPGVRAAGFKLMYGQAGALPELLPALAARGARAVHLVRENLLDVVVSHEAAAARGIYHARGTAPADAAPVRLNAGELVARLTGSERSVVRARRRLAELGLPAIEIRYEDVAADRAALTPALRLLEVEDRPLRSSLRRLVRADHPAVIENYAEVGLALAGSRYAGMLR